MFERVFLDANILADLYDETRPYHSFSRKAVSSLLEIESVELFTSCDIITTIYYIDSKRDKKMALEHVREINGWCHVVEFGNKEVEESCRLMRENDAFDDLEDTLQYVMARKVGADLILSNDTGFVSDDIPVMGSDAFCKNRLR
jgi:predicted nucleic acid-binding protein